MLVLMTLMVNTFNAYLSRQVHTQVTYLNNMIQRDQALKETKPVENQFQVKQHHFYTQLGQANYVEQQVAAINSYAASRNLELPAASYSLEVLKAERLQKYSIKLKARGTYVSLRAFIDDSLKYIPFMYLSNLAIKRHPGNAGQIEADLQFVVLLNEEAMSH